MTITLVMLAGGVVGVGILVGVVLLAQPSTSGPVALALLDALPEDLARQVSAVRVSSANLVTFTLGKRTVVWGGGEESVRKVAILEALLPTKAKVIDVSAPDTPVTR